MGVRASTPPRRLPTPRRAGALAALALALAAREARADPPGAGFNQRDFALVGGYGAALTYVVGILRGDPFAFDTGWGRSWSAGVDLRFYRRGGEGIVARALYLDVAAEDATGATRARGALLEFGAAYRFPLAGGRRVGLFGHGAAGLSGMIAEGSRGALRGVGVTSGAFAIVGVDLRLVERVVIGVSLDARYQSAFFLPHAPSWAEGTANLRAGVDF